MCCLLLSTEILTAKCVQLLLVKLHKDLDKRNFDGSRLGPNHLVPGASFEFALEDENVTRLTRVTEGWIEDFDAVKVLPSQKIAVLSPL